MAVKNRPIDQKLIFHSDRGVQYACDAFVKQLEGNKNIIRSMSRKGNCWDNAVAENFFKTLKTEQIYPSKLMSAKQTELVVFEYIECWYNRLRRHSALNGLNMVEFQQLNNLKNVA
jgi:putative transposase